MAIPMTNWVDITSKEATTDVSDRELILRVITNNKAIEPGTVYPFTSASGMASLFGTNSEESKVATKYFGYVSNSATKPQKIQFYRIPTGRIYNNDVGTLQGEGQVEVTRCKYKTVTEKVYGETTTEVMLASQVIHAGYVSEDMIPTAADNWTFPAIVKEDTKRRAYTKLTWVEPQTDGEKKNPFYDCTFVAWTVNEAGNRVYDWDNQANDFVYTTERHPQSDIPEFSNAEGYLVGEIVKHENKCYAAKVVVPVGNDWVEDQWTEVTVAHEDGIIFQNSKLTEEILPTESNPTVSAETYLVEDSDYKRRYDRIQYISGEGSERSLSVTYANFTTSHYEDEGELVTETVEAADVVADGITRTLAEGGSIQEELRGTLYRYTQIVSVTADCVGALEDMVDADDNFGTFFYLYDMDTEDWERVCSWVQSKNGKFRLNKAVDLAQIAKQSNVATASSRRVVWTKLDTADAYLASFKYAGVHCVLDDAFKLGNSTHPEWFSAALLAATRYSQNNSTIIQEFKGVDDGNMTVTVEDESLYTILNDLNINFYGETQKAGKKLDFYMSGFNMDGTDTSVYDNEMWFKDRVESEIMNRFTGSNKIPAGIIGRSMIKTAVLDVMSQALSNLTVVPEKDMDSSTRADIIEMTGDSGAPNEIFKNGYYLQVNDGDTKVLAGGAHRRTIDYILYYSDGEGIRKVSGSDVYVS